MQPGDTGGLVGGVSEDAAADQGEGSAEGLDARDTRSAGRSRPADQQRAGEVGVADLSTRRGEVIGRVSNGAVVARGVQPPTINAVGLEVDDGRAASLKTQIAGNARPADLGADLEGVG